VKHAKHVPCGGFGVALSAVQGAAPCAIEVDTFCENRFGDAVKLMSAKVLFAGIVVACSIFLLGEAGLLRASGGDHAPPASRPAKITIDYPLDGSVFPPEITPPTFLWRDASETAKRWVVEVSFADHSGGIRVEAPGQHMRVGELDPEAGPMNDLLQLTPEQAATLTWRPDADTWEKIKRGSVKSPAMIAITGFADDHLQLPVSSGTVTISTSPDPVGAPIFYRDVPLMLWPKTEKGSIQPLPPFAIPLIKWKLRNIAEPQSRTVMEKLPTCANCHSFSTDGKTLGIDLDGPKNDKGLYALVPVAKNMAIRNQDVIRWSSFQENPEARSSEPAVKRFGFMSQISPDGRFVVTSIGPPGLGNTHQNELPGFAPGIADRLYSMNFKGPPFNQVFYPTRGILAWYDQREGKLRPLPGADDTRFVQTSAFWSPDGKYLIFSRAEARDSYPSGAPQAEYANDPNETQIQYDLYRIPFNEGKGGKAEPVAGASHNGMSNNFPKVSPDGRWIVFVQNRNGLLMRPDSKLYIVPFAGGKARLMNCNTSLMNSWHTFSPNGRWLAFSSKARSPYTRLMLTHIDEHGNDTPAIIVDDTTAANRAVNIPEFVNVPPDGLQHIDPQATEYYRLFNQAYDLMEQNQVAEAIPVLRQAVERAPEEPIGHYALAVALSQTDQDREAVEEYHKACALNANPPAAWFDRLALSQARSGDLEGAIANLKKSLALDPADAGAEDSLGTVLFETGQAQEGEEHLRKAIAMAPDFADAYNHLGWELAKTARLDEAVVQLQKAIELRPTSVEYHANLGYVMGLRGDFAGAVPVFQKAVKLSEGKDWRCLDMLAKVYDKVGRSAEAVESERLALDLVLQQHDEQLEKNLRDNLERYERDSAKAQSQ
jgi:Flp pilus assembly protein TadD